jgi:hypothetical protein
MSKFIRTLQASTSGHPASPQESAARQDLTLALSISDVQRETGFGRTFIYGALTLKGGLVARKAGRRTVILRADLERYLESLPKIGAEK